MDFKKLYQNIPRIFKSKLFLFVLLLKIILSFLFASDFLVKGTIPFVNFFVTDGSNPYEYFYHLGILKAFPYPTIMLVIMSFFRFIIGLFLNLDWNIINSFSLFVFRLPLLFSDILIYWVLMQLLKPKEVLVTILYWCSPILIYVNYIHGQLDVIPIAMLMLFIYFIYRNNFVLSSILLGLGMATKTHIVLAFPIYFIYLWKQRLKLKLILLNTTLTITTYIVSLLPFIISKEFFKMVFLAPEQFRIFDLSISLGNINIFIVPAIFLIIILSISTLSNFNKELLVLVLTLIFSVLVVFVSPMPGWYYWTIPLITFFLVKEAKLGQILTYGLLNIFYLLNIIFSKSSDIFESFQIIIPNISHINVPYDLLLSFGFRSDIFSNIIVTLLTSTLILIIYWVYSSGISNNIKYNLVNRPFTVGIGGDSSSGKTTLTKSFIFLTGESNATVISGDDSHKWERGNKNWKKLTHLNPLANKLYLNFDHAKELIFGRKISRKKYEHSTGKFSKPYIYFPKRFIFFEGLHQYLVPEMRKSYDIKIFMDIDERLRKEWKISRDMKKRNYSRKKILSQLNKRDMDSKRYINPQKKHADIIIKYIPLNKLRLNNNNNNNNIKFKVEISLKEYINVDDLKFRMNKHGVSFKYEYEKNTFNLFIKFNGKISSSMVREIAFDLIPDLSDILNNFEPKWLNNNSGILQIILLMSIKEKINYRK